MEYESLCWMSASSSTMKLLDSIQSKALQIIGVNDQQANSDPLATSQTPCTSCISTVQDAQVNVQLTWRVCSLNPTCFQWRSTRSSLSMPSHALSVPVSRTHSTDRTFIYTTVKAWNELPDNVVGVIHDEGFQPFNSGVNHHLWASRFM